MFVSIIWRVTALVVPRHARHKHSNYGPCSDAYIVDFKQVFLKRAPPIFLAYSTFAIGRPIRNHPFSTHAKFCEKLTFFTSLKHTRTCAYQEVRSVSFSQNFACVLKRWFLNKCLFSKPTTTTLEIHPRTCRSGVFIIDFYIYNLTVPRPNLGHCQGGRLTQLVVVTAHCSNFNPKLMASRNKEWSLIHTERPLRFEQVKPLNSLSYS